MLFISFLEEESSLRGQIKLAVHAVRLCQLKGGSTADIKNETLAGLLQLLECSVAFNNVNLRHCLFCILQVLAGRYPKPPEDNFNQMYGADSVIPEASREVDTVIYIDDQTKYSLPSLDAVNLATDVSALPEPSREVDAISNIRSRYHLQHS